MTASPEAAGAIRVLIADDTPDIRLLLGIALRLAGDFEVIGEAGDGELAISMARELQPDIILLDLAMPVMDGLQALPDIAVAAPAALIVVLSGFGADTMATEAIARGAHDYVQKGINPTELTDRLRQRYDAHEIGSSR